MVVVVDVVVLVDVVLVVDVVVVEGGRARVVDVLLVGDGAVVGGIVAGPSASTIALDSRPNSASN